MHTSTHTHAKLRVTESAFEEIRAKLEKAGYGDQINYDPNNPLIDMHGLALVIEGRPRGNIGACCK